MFVLQVILSMLIVLVIAVAFVALIMGGVAIMMFIADKLKPYLPSTPKGFRDAGFIFLGTIAVVYILFLWVMIGIELARWLW